MEILEHFITTAVGIFLVLLYTKKFINKEIETSFSHTILYVALYIIFIGLNQFNNISMMRTIITVVTTSVLVKILFKVTYQKSTLISFFVFIFVLSSQIIFTLITRSITNIEVLRIVEENTIISSFIMYGIGSILVFVFSKSLNVIMASINEKEELSIFVSYLLLLALLVVSFNIHYLSDWGMKKSNLLPIILMLLFIVFFFVSIRQNTKHFLMQKKYNYLVKYATVYDDLLREYQISSHEYQNQLGIIKNLKTKKQVNEYIDSLVTKKVKTKNLWIKELKNIKFPGICALLNYKLSEMVDNGINVSFFISSKISKYNKTNIEKSTLKDLYSILGVLLDNAKEGAKDSDLKKVMIDVSEDKEYVYIQIINTYNKLKVNLKLIGNMGYSSKGTGRGRGLYLINGLIKKLDRVSLEKQVDKKYFKQIIKIRK